jgi:predicted DNA binding protein
VWAALAGTTVIEECLVVAVRVTDDHCPLAAASRAADATVEAGPPQRRSDGTVLFRCSAPAARPDAPVDGEPLARALDDDDRVGYLHATRTDDRVTCRCLSTAPCVLARLVDAGLLVEASTYRSGTERHVGAVVGYDVLQAVLAPGADSDEDPPADPSVTVERVHPLAGEGDEAVAGRWSLTPKQARALRVALEMGYFEVPREADAGAVAAELGVGKSAFLERLRRAQARLFPQVL